MEKEINILSIFNENKKTIIITTLLSMLMMLFYIILLANPVYEAKTQVLIFQSNKQDNRIDSQDVQANLNLVSTYSKIISSPRVLNQVNNNLNNKYNLDDLAQMIKISNDASSQIIEIKVDYSNYKEAAEIANETAHVFKLEVPKLMNIDNVNLLSEADVNAKVEPIRPRKILLMIFSFILGIIIGITIILVKVLTNRTVKVSDDITDYLGINVLGQINTVSKKDFV